MSQSEENSDINDVYTLLANMVVEGKRLKAVLRLYTNWKSSSALLHEHLLEGGVEVTRERPVPLPLADEVREKHFVTNRPKGGSVSVTEFVISWRGLQSLAGGSATKPPK